MMFPYPLALRIFFAGVIGCIVWAIADCGFGSHENGLQTVKTSDLFKKTVLVGELGFPLGTEVRITGKWIIVDSNKSQERHFSVTHINGVKAEIKIIFHEQAISPSSLGGEKIAFSEGKIWELRGFETGLFEGIPQKFYSEKKFTEFAYPQGGAFRFVNRFEYFDAREVGSK